MEYPEVTVTELSVIPVTDAKGVNLGNPELNSLANHLIEQLKNRAKKIFHLKWEGSKVPRGVVINDIEIVWTQNGQVVGRGGKTLGVYERLVEFGGESKNEQQMLIFAF